MRQTNKSISEFIPKSFRADCKLPSDLNAKYLVFHGRHYVYVVYLTRVQGGRDKMWKIVHGRYLREWKSQNMTGTQAALNIANAVEPTVVTNPIE